MMQKLLGAEHPHVAKVLFNLAALLARRGRLRDAMPLFEQTLRIEELQRREISSRDRHADGLRPKRQRTGNLAFLAAPSSKPPSPTSVAHERGATSQKDEQGKQGRLPIDCFTILATIRN